MVKFQILEAIRLMQPVERLEVIEFALSLIREEMTKTTTNQQIQQLSLKDSAALMRSYYTEGNSLTAFSDDICQEDFYQYEDYA
ncbi:MAG: hypothetical protein DCF19_05770 [Pseudanabaena frigida]|uniref:Uncharacterized protein n=1 Tax=Pseudanabaena frigida TaxID=945775 RepID=A0A2W4WJR6_9CYAN|nr:MAG: hypothetical protein DCF19_05770 [Pseudanabaena frigida]